MSLLDELRGIENFPPSHLPSTSEALELLGKLIAYAEHGDKLVDAARQDAQARQADEPASGIDDLLSPPETDEPPPAAPSAAPSPAAPSAASPPAASPPAAPAPEQAGAADVDVDPETRIAELEQQIANLRAQQGRTQVDVNAAEQPDRSPWSRPTTPPADPGIAGPGW